MAILKTDEMSTATKVHLLLRLLGRILQFILALTVIGLYASELKQTHDSPRYVYAVVVGAASALTCAVYFVPAVKSYVFFGWDALLFVLWTAVFGAMGTYFIDPKTEARANDHKMRNAVWVDLVNMMLWFVTATAGAVMFMAHRRQNRTQHTGRANV